MRIAMLVVGVLGGCATTGGHQLSNVGVTSPGMSGVSSLNSIEGAWWVPADNGGTPGAPDAWVVRKGEALELKQTPAGSMFVIRMSDARVGATTLQFTLEQGAGGPPNMSYDLHLDGQYLVGTRTILFVNPHATDSVRLIRKPWNPAP